MIEAGDIVKHKKKKYLKRGQVTEISKSGKRAMVKFKAGENPELYYTDHTYYNVDSLEKISWEER